MIDLARLPDDPQALEAALRAWNEDAIAEGLDHARTALCEAGLTNAEIAEALRVVEAKIREACEVHLQRCVRMAIH